ncbi:MAG: GbsR/MarR family transcriptional regulator [Puniceicoccaceae bacterium]
MKDAAADAARSALEPLRGEMIDFMVRMFRLMGLPKTIGSIYGFIYSSADPVSMDDLTHALGISLGSASQGLRTLKVFRAIKPVYAPGERRERFEAETDFQRFVGAFLRGELEQYVENTSRRTQRMKRRLAELPEGPEKEFFAARVLRLSGMNVRAKAMIPLLEGVFSSGSGGEEADADG